MSLFIGKDSNNNSIIHITDTVTDTTTLKNGLTTNTVFHSDFPFIYAVYQESLTFSIQRAYTTSATTYFYKISPTLIDFITQNDYLYIVVINETLIYQPTRVRRSTLVTSINPNPTNIWANINDVSLSSGLIVSCRPTLDTPYICITEPNLTINSVKLVVLSLTTTSVLPLPTIKNEVKLSNNSIEIKGHNLATIPFLYHKQIKSTDPSISFSNNATLALANYLQNTANSLYADNNELSILYDNQKVFSTLTPPLTRVDNTLYTINCNFNAATTVNIPLGVKYIGILSEGLLFNSNTNTSGSEYQNIQFFPINLTTPVMFYSDYYGILNDPNVFGFYFMLEITTQTTSFTINNGYLVNAGGTGMISPTTGSVPINYILLY